VPDEQEVLGHYDKVTVVNDLLLNQEDKPQSYTEQSEK